MIPLPPHPRPTSPPTHYLGKRHFYTCDGTTLAWQPEWYSQPFYTSSSSSFDAAASLGPVNPPISVLVGDAACPAATRTSAVSGQSSGSAGASAGPVLLTVISTSGGSTFERTITSVLGASASSRAQSSSGLLSSSGPTSSLLTSTPISSSLISSTSSLSLSSSASIAPTPLAQITDPSSINKCAGEMDFQAWGAIAGVGFTAIVGGLLWVLWAILRGRLRDLYSPRTYFVPSDSRPSTSFSLLAFFLPFLPGSHTSSGSTMLPVVLASLKLLVMSALVALAAGLPLILVNTPCVSQTSPTNYLGGRLGSLSDLSLLRILNSLDPSPESSSRDTSLQLLFQTSLHKRALPQTIGPALSSARIRLILILVLIGLLSLVGGLWVVTRTYAKISAQRKKFEQDTCGGMDIVVVAAKDAPGWKGMSEEKLRKSLMADMGGKEDENLSVIGVFAIPDTTDLRSKISEREKALMDLESKEAEYLHDSVARPLLSPHRPTSVTTPFPSITEDQSQLLLRPETPVPDRPSADSAGPSAYPHRPSLSGHRNHSRFREINRNSLQSSFVQFEIGQRIKVDETGRYVPDPSPESEGGRASLGGNFDSLSNHSRSTRSAGRSADEVNIVPGPAKQPDLQPSPPYRSQQPSAVPSPSSHPSSEVERARAKLKELDEEVEVMQSIAMRNAATGGDTVCWVVVGRGVRFLPGSTRVEGCTLEDIAWRHVGNPAGDTGFWVKIILFGVILAIILVPFIGLTSASAPGFAHYLPFLESIARSDGFGSGVVQGFVPALVMFLVVLAAVQGSIVLAHRVPTVSRSRRDLLATQATFWLLLSLCVVWALLVSALEFATQALAGEAQKARSVSDGAVYSTWWLFVFVLNIAIILPVIILLQPRRLIAYLRQRSAKTPRMLFRAGRPTPLSPALLLAGPLLAVFYTLTLALIFPLLCIALLVLLYLSFIVLRHMTDRVNVDFSFNDGYLALWLIRRLGWCLGIQPFLYALILLSRREWAIGGVSCGIAVLAVIFSEMLTARRLPERRYGKLDNSTRSRLEIIAAGMRNPSTRTPGLTRPTSDSSMLQRLTTPLPGYSRLPSSCPLPLRPDTIDDMTHTELASATRRDLVKGRDKDGDRFFHDPTETNKGMIYPPEMLQPPVVVWLPYTRGAEAENEAAELEGLRGLVAIVDPAPKDRRGKKEEI